MVAPNPASAPPSPTSQTKPPNASSSISSSPPASPPYSSSPLLGLSQTDGASQTTSPTLPESSIQPSPRSSPTEEVTPLKYSVASHSVRITKYGYAVDPIELRYPEIIKNLSAGARRGSEVSFDSGQSGHKILSLIRGFWSQPGFPRGKSVRNDKLNSINSMLNEFAQYPLYPHDELVGSMAKARPKVAPKRIKKFVSKSTINQMGKFNNGQDDSSASPRPNDQSRPSSPPFDVSSAKTKRVGSDILSLFISKQAKSPPAADPSNQLPPGRSSSSFHSWIPKSKEQGYELIIKLLHKMERIFSSESRIINITSPCTVLGDIHGNLNDLRTYERSLWPKAPNCLACNYLFLGDYVDRGEYSIECVLYLFAMKSLVPNRFYLLRGNHEVAAIQRQYTFGRECETKFGSYGRDLWLAFNKVFDLMPVAAVIDKQIFCAHGGIPRSVSDIKVLADEIPSPLDNPEIQCPAAWEILWNDPITDSELIGMIEMDNAVPTTTIQIGQQAQPSPPKPQSPSQQKAQVQTQPQAQGPQQQQQQQVAANASLASDKDDNNSDIDDFNAAMNRAPSASLSFYITPENNSKTGAADQAKSISRASKEANPNESRDDENKLRKVPSDTSSIASSSPQQIVNDGFIANIKRGTAFLFSDQAVSNFLKLNRLSHVIRAHEVIPTGFAFHGEGRVITIFSSSKYCGLNNQAACALVERDKIRILRLDTGE